MPLTVAAYSFGVPVPMRLRMRIPRSNPVLSEYSNDLSGSRGDAVIVLQQSAQPLLALD